MLPVHAARLRPRAAPVCDLDPEAIARVHLEADSERAAGLPGVAVKHSIRCQLGQAQDGIIGDRAAI